MRGPASLALPGRKGRLLVSEASKFSVVGVANIFLDAGTFNLFHFYVGLGPLMAKVLASAVAITSSYLGNRHWSFRHRLHRGVMREYLAFAALSVVGSFIALGALAVARYWLGIRGLIGLNLAAYVVGTGLAFVFRFWAYRRWVFPLSAPGAHGAHPHRDLALVARSPAVSSMPAGLPRGPAGGGDSHGCRLG